MYSLSENFGTHEKQIIADHDPDQLVEKLKTKYTVDWNSKELRSRGTVHLRMLVPRGIAGVTEDDRATLQAWLELVDWTGLGIAPKYPTPRRLKLNMDSTSTMHQWLTLQERQCGVHHHDAAQMFTDFRKELETLAKAIANQESNVVGRVEVMSGGAVLGTAPSPLCMGNFLRNHPG